MIDAEIVRKVAEEYLRNCDSGLGEADCWLFAIEAVQEDLSQEQLEALVQMARGAACSDCETQQC